MKKIITLLIGIMIVLLPMPVAAQNDTYESIIAESGDHVTKLHYENGTTSVCTYEGNNLMFKSYLKDDGNVYMLIDNKEILAVEITYKEMAVPLMSTDFRRAPSVFLLTNSGAVQNIKITGNVIEAGKAAVQNVLVDMMTATIVGKKMNLTDVAWSALEGLASYICNNYTTYDTDIIRNSYVYNGCNWLLYNEFVYPEGYTIGAYYWTDNPSLGVAPYTCKLASKSYPY